MLRITHFTDPSCPFAYSAEPHRRHAAWRYGDAITWHTRMVVLSESADEMTARGFGPAEQRAAFTRIGEAYGMPFDLRERPRMIASVVPCRAVVGVREHGDPVGADRLLRALRVAYMVDARLPDEPEVVADAARAAGLDPGQVAAWAEDPATEDALRADMAAARHPSPEARAMDHKLAGWGEGGGRRYTCPSWEISDSSRRLSVPGFHPWNPYEVALANLAPEAPTRPAPEDPREVLAWAGESLAAVEVAAVMETDRAAAETALRAAGAHERRGMWSLT